MATPGTAEFGSTRLALADARLAGMLLNQARHWALRSVFGTTREQDNALTAVLLLVVADGTLAVTRKLPTPHLSGMGVGEGAFGVREALLGIAGPSGRDVPGTAAVIGFALVAGAAAPGITRGARQMRQAQSRVRASRIARYRAADAAFKGRQEPETGAAVRAAQATARDSSAFTKPSLPAT